ncbi:MAG TPA: hypothetical protein PKD00_00185 [Burkholderiales bacterium]|nr:hypothetical protein [Burkholderiales bacterium]
MHWKEIIKIPYIQEQIYNYYIPNCYLTGKPFKSPFRKDNNPSFSILKIGSYYKWADWGTNEKGNCFDFVAKYYGLNVNKQFNLVLKAIVKDLNYEHLFNTDSKVLINFIKNNVQLNKELHTMYSAANKVSSVKLKYNKKPFNQSEIDYWKSQGLINIDTLKYLNIHSVSKAYIIINDYVKMFYNYNDYKLHSNDENIKKLYYCFAYNYDNKYLKIYRPYYIDKWKSTVPLNLICTKTLFGNDNLIITKAKKEQVHLLDIQSYMIDKFDILPLNNEITFPHDFIESIKDNYKKIILWLDNDNIGIFNMKKWAEQHNLTMFYSKNFKNITDQYSNLYSINSDMAKNNSLLTIKNLLQ